MVGAEPDARSAPSLYTEDEMRRPRHLVVFAVALCTIASLGMTRSGGASLSGNAGVRTLAVVPRWGSGTCPGRRSRGVAEEGVCGGARGRPAFDTDAGSHGWGIWTVDEYGHVRRLADDPAEVMAVTSSRVAVCCETRQTLRSRASRPSTPGLARNLSGLPTSRGLLKR